MFKKLQENLASVAAVIAVIAGIGAGFIQFGKLEQKVESLGSVDISSVEELCNRQIARIAVLEKTIEILELQINEIKLSQGNPLGN